MDTELILMHFIFAEACVRAGLDAEEAADLYAALGDVALPESVYQWVQFIEAHIGA